MLISYAQDAGAHGHGMDELSRLHLGHTPISYDEVTGTGRKRGCRSPRCRSTAPPPTPPRTPTSRCGCGRRCARACGSNGALALYEQLERRLVPVLLEMERAGIKVDADDLRAHVGGFRGRAWR